MVKHETVEATAETAWIPPALSLEEARERTVTFWSGAEGQGAPGQTMLKAVRPSRRPSRLAIKPYVLQKDMTPDGKADFELIKPLGEGGMGEVYAARQACMDRTVAIKMIRADAREDVERQARFLSEAAVTGELDHPNIVPIHSLGSSSEGGLFYAMKHVKGLPWSDAMASMSLDENLDALQRVADAVAFAHSRDVIHMDLKPENVMLGHFGEVYVLDWGLAASVHKPGKAQLITETDLIGGTPAYMAPEMAAGDTDRISFTSDIYLLGAILFEILTGTTPHVGKDASACLVEAAQNAIQETDCESPFLPIAYKAMATETDDRFESVLAFQGALRECRSHNESHILFQQARRLLKEARESGSYETFSESLFGYREALRLWPENTRAAKGLMAARYTYAGAAYKRGDYDLALSLLEGGDKRHKKLRTEIEAAATLRRDRQRRMGVLSGIAKGLAAALFVILAGSVWWIAAEKSRVEQAEASTRSALAQEQEARAELEKMRLRLEKVLGLGATVPPQEERNEETVTVLEKERRLTDRTKARTDEDQEGGIARQIQAPVVVDGGPVESEKRIEVEAERSAKTAPPSPGKQEFSKPGESVSVLDGKNRAMKKGKGNRTKVDSREGLAAELNFDESSKSANDALGSRAQPRDHQNSAAPRAETATHPLLLLYRSALLQCDLKAARRYAAYLAKQNGPFQETGVDCLADIKDLEVLLGAVQRSLAKRGKARQTLTLGQGHKVSGRVDVVDSGKIRFHQPGGEPIVKTVLDLSPETLALLLKENDEIGGEATERLLALSAYARGDQKEAARFFKAIESEDPRSDHHAQMLRW